MINNIVNSLFYRVYRENYNKLDILLGGVEAFMNFWPFNGQIRDLESNSSEDKIHILHSGTSGIELMNVPFSTLKKGEKIIINIIFEIHIFFDLKMAEAINWLPNGTIYYKSAYKKPGKYNRQNLKEMNYFLSYWLDQLIIQGFHYVSRKRMKSPLK